MKKSFTIFSLALLMAVSATAQKHPRPPRNGMPPPPPSSQQQEKIKTMKIGFITERLNLTSEEATVFWPIYNKYQDEIEQLRKSRKDNLASAKQDIDQMSDKDVEKVVDADLAFRQSELDLIKKYNHEYKKVLPMKKVGKLYRAEEDFKRKLLEMIQEKRQEKKERIPREH